MKSTKALSLALLALTISVVFVAVVDAKWRRDHPPIKFISEEKGCEVSKGFHWCENLDRCVKTAELSKQIIKTFDDHGYKTFVSYCGVPSSLEAHEAPNTTTHQQQPTSDTTSSQKRSVAGSDTDSYGCVHSAGYTWCAREEKCIRPWELSKEQGISSDAQSINSYCSVCLASAGYSWCEKEGRCVRPWELAKQHSLSLDDKTFAEYCSGKLDAIAKRDQHKKHHIQLKKDKKISHESVFKSTSQDCDAKSGYIWCARENKCSRPSDILTGNPKIGPASFARYCSTQASIHKQLKGAPIEPLKTIGGQVDEHNCFASAGYTWCQAESKCVRPWELAKEKKMSLTTMSDILSYCSGNPCHQGTGYSWCAKENKCVRPWELASIKQLKLNTPESFSAYCSSQ